MKTTKNLRAVSWTLLLALVLTLFPVSAFAAVEEAPKLTLSSGGMTIDEEEVWDYDASVKQGSTNVTGNYTISWDTELADIATVDASGTVTGVSPGVTTITATATCTQNGVTTTLTQEVTVTVSGIVLNENTMELLENERADLPGYSLYGEAKNGVVTWSSSNTEVARVSRDTYVDGLSVGDAEVTAKVEGTNYSAVLGVTVKANQATNITETLDAGANLDLSRVESKINTQCQTLTDSTLSYVTGLSVSTDHGILFENYLSEEEPGAGVAQSGNYYVTSAARGPYFSDITFVPNPYYTGETVTIQYTGVSANKRSFNGRIVVTLAQEENDLTLAATPSSPAEFTSMMFNEVCQRLTSSTLDYVTFSLPASSRGTLYYDYVSDIDYDSKVELGKKYTLSQLDDISFVPAAGFTGTVDIYYTGYTISNRRFTGQILITVTQSTEGGPVYNIGKSGVVTFDEDDFDDYCSIVTGEDLDRVRFSLPDSDEGVLYYDYKSSTSTGSRVSSATAYYADRTPRISRISFVPDEDFSGTVEIPFTGWDEDNTSFNGVVEINVRSTGSGDVTYTCYPGSYVKFDRSDFYDLCEEITDRGLSYITFQTLPGSGDGTLYTGKTSSKNGTKVTRGTKYYYSNLSNMSFWANDDFEGSAEITFTGVASGGDSFSGVLKITSQDTWEDEINYTTGSGDLITFDEDDFDDLAWDAVGEQLRYVRFTLPDDDEGILYYNYSNSRSSKVTATKSYYFNSSPYLSKVGFMPDEDFSGMVEIPFKGYTSSDNFSGVVKIYVQAGENQGTDVTYTTTYAPVTFSVADFEMVNESRSGVASVVFGDMPSSDEGYLYYQYSGPNQYSWKASSGISYKASGSPRLGNLTFVPKANYQGRVILPYTATRVNGSKFSGDVVIYVEANTVSHHFSDLSGHTSSARAAVDYLYENGVVVGMTSTTYGPYSSIRRGDFALMLYKAFNLYAPSSSESFRDVPDGAYYADAVNTLRALGIVSGSGGNMYQPNAMLTRQDAMLMVQKTLQAAGWSAQRANEDLLGDYKDAVQVSSYAREAMAYVVQWDLLPTSNYRLSPTAELTRIDMAQVLHRALTY